MASRDSRVVILIAGESNDCEALHFSLPEEILCMVSSDYMTSLDGLQEFGYFEGQATENWHVI